MNKQENYRLLSYSLAEDTPVYGGREALQIEEERQIKKGDTCNTFKVSFMNHSGTHIDAPRHFFNSGRPIIKYSLEELFFDRPFILDVPKKQDELITGEDLQRVKKCNILLIRTGFFRFRRLKKYIFHNPGFSAEVAEFIRKWYPYIRAIGIDTVSISSYQNRIEGRQAHRILLKEARNKRGVLLIEDMNLSSGLSNLKEVFILPFQIKNIDSAPCTVIGRFL